MLDKTLTDNTADDMGK